MSLLFKSGSFPTCYRHTTPCLSSVQGLILYISSDISGDGLWRCCYGRFWGVEYLNMADSPTVRVRRHAQSKGWVYGNAETRQGPISRDLWGWADGLLLAGDGCEVPAGEPTLIAVQITSASNRSSRRRKMLASSTLRLWLADGTRGAALTTTGTRKGVKVIRWTTFTLPPGGGDLIETDEWIEG